MRLLLVIHESEPVIGSIIVGSGERVFVTISATHDRPLNLRAGYASRWAIINRLRGTHARWLDLGGTEGDPGLRHYREGKVGKRGSIVAIPGEFDFAPNALAVCAVKVIVLWRELTETKALKRLITILPL